GAPPVPSDDGELKRGRGRPKEDEAANRKRVCWELYTSGKKKTLAMREARDRLKNNAPKEWTHLRTDAKRHAKENGLPCERPNCEKTPEKQGGAKIDG